MSTPNISSVSLGFREPGPPSITAALRMDGKELAIVMAA
jgi:hypothetical protein